MLKACISSVLLMAILPSTVFADKKYDDLLKKLEQLERQLKQVKKTLKQQAATVKKVERRSTQKTVYVKTGNVPLLTREEGRKLERKINVASEWRDPRTFIHMSGYANVGYSDGTNKIGSYTLGTFSPIFHFQYKDLVMLEAEIEFELEPDGTTKTSIDYLTIDWFINDYAALVMGKFLSPIGQFRQNLHPSWINKLPSAPPGFGHDGAAPVSDTGMQIRGGFPIGRVRTNYAIYVGNGPELTTEWDGTQFELDGIDAEGKGADRDDEKVWGGRFAILPFRKFEIGVSALTGKATVTAIEGVTGAPTLASEQARSYRVYGLDFAWQYKALNFRGEYVKSKIGNAVGGTSASDGGVWTAWYTQAAYRIPATRLELVTRYTDFDSPSDAKDKKQWAVGLNYLFTSNFVAKFAFESNDGQSGAVSDDDRWYFQIAYGF